MVAQQRFGNSAFEIAPTTTRARKFMDELNRVIPWLSLFPLVAHYAPKGEMGQR